MNGSKSMVRLGIDLGKNCFHMDNRFYSDKKSHSRFREDRSFAGVQWYIDRL